ncbi:985_t:CDS:2 [Dentiscutata erythropus]|uniref:985_t:CDS:1 n=1 Tax=Dentiscutata erythropus TaxID=1348616 RepID=A0A9N9EJL7_9GLOM|nr:985_t:CDS:2 [Dentiscutata erythropus]
MQIGNYNDKDSILYCKKKYNKCSIHNHIIVKYEDYSHFSKEEFTKNMITIDSGKNHLAICQYSYNDLNNFSKCVWCNLECCFQRTLARYDENSGPFDYSDGKIYKASNKIGNNQFIKRTNNNSKEIIEDLFEKCLTSDKVIVKHKPENN